MVAATVEYITKMQLLRTMLMMAHNEAFKESKIQADTIVRFLNHMTTDIHAA